MKRSKKIKKAKEEIELIAKKYGFEMRSIDIRERVDEITLNPYLILKKKTIS